MGDTYAEKKEKKAAAYAQAKAKFIGKYLTNSLESANHDEIPELLQLKNHFRKDGPDPTETAQEKLDRQLAEEAARCLSTLDFSNGFLKRFRARILELERIKELERVKELKRIKELKRSEL